MAGIFQNGLYTQGFDYTQTSTQIFDLSNVPTMSAAQARFAAPPGAVSQGIQYPFNNTSRKIFGVNLPIFVTGFAFKSTAITVAVDPIMWFYDNTIGDTQFSLSLNSNAQLILNSGNTGYPNGTQTTIATSSPVLQTAVWNYIEVQSTISSNVNIGNVQVRLNGNTIINFAGSTQFSTNAFINAIALGQTSGAGGTPTHNYDDWYILDMTGTFPLNTFLGDSRILYWPPTADSATSGLNAFTTSPVQPVGSHFLNVNAAPNNLGATFNLSGNPGDRESYRHFPASIGSILATNTIVMFEKDDANSRSCAITTRSGAIDSIGATIASPSSYAYFNKVDVVDPLTQQPWSPQGFSAAEQGFKVIS